MDTGQALTRFFQRDSTKANNLTLYPNMEDEFWLWVSSWALFITKPSDLNPDYSDDGYVLPPLDVRWHEIPIHYGDSVDRDGQMELFTQANIINEINTKLTRMKVLEGCEAVESEIEERYMTDLAGQLYKELDEVKKHGSDVKGRLAAVITEKGVPTASNESFDDMIANAKKISTGAYGMIINTSLYTKPYGYVCGIYGLLPTETEVS